LAGDFVAMAAVVVTPSFAAIGKGDEDGSFGWFVILHFPPKELLIVDRRTQHKSTEGTKIIG
jgi:hypothetical protein